MAPAVIFASFGTSDKAAREGAISSVVRDASERFPDVCFVEAYTSAFIRKRLAAQGESVLSLEECLEMLAQEGRDTVYIQPLHLTPGEEYDNKLRPVFEQYADRFSHLALGEPLFYEWADGVDDDYAAALDVLRTIYPSVDGEALVLLGHGSPHRHNPVYERLQCVVDRTGLPICIGVIEETDTPDFSMVAERLAVQRASRVCLAPLLLSGGIHVTEDMAGDGDTSWKRRLEGRGFHVRTQLRGLGEYSVFRQLYIRKLLNLMKKKNL